MALLPFVCFSQSFNIDGSIATDNGNNLFIYNFNPGVGVSITNNDYIFGGIKFQAYNLIPKSDRDEDDVWTTTTVLNFLVYSGVRHLIPLVRINKNSEDEYIIGIFPEGKLYFNPYVPRKLKYINDNNIEKTAEGDYSCQLAYALGFGVFFRESNEDNYLALNFEFSTIDAFKTIRTLNVENKHFDFPTQKQFSVGLSLFF